MFENPFFFSGAVYGFLTGLAIGIAITGIVCEILRRRSQRTGNLEAEQ